MALTSRDIDYLSMAVAKFPAMIIELAELAENVHSIYFKRAYNDANTGLISEATMTEINQISSFAALESDDIVNMIILAEALNTAFGNKSGGALSNCIKIVNPKG